MPRSDWMDGRATPTMETSRASRNRTTHRTERAPHRRAPQRSSLTGGVMGENVHAHALNAQTFNAFAYIAQSWYVPAQRGGLEGAWTTPTSWLWHGVSCSPGTRRCRARWI